MSGLELIAMARSLRDDAAYASGRPLSVATAFFIGAALAPHARYGDGVQVLASRKVAAGADFLVTQPLFDHQSLPRFLADAGSTLDECFVLAGLGAATRFETLTALTASDEVYVPAEFTEQLRAAPSNARRLQLGIDHVLAIAEQALASGASGVLVYPFDCGVEETLTLCEALRPLLASQRTTETV